MPRERKTRDEKLGAEKPPRQGWAKAFEAAKERGDDRLLLGDKVVNAFDHTEWTW